MPPSVRIGGRGAPGKSGSLWAIGDHWTVMWCEGGLLLAVRGCL
jgi:hypothetical protein